MVEQPELRGRKFTLIGEDLPSPIEVRIVEDGKGGLDAHRSSNSEGFKYEFWGKAVLVNSDDPIIDECHTSWDDGNRALGILWGGGRVTKEGNPVVLEYSHSPETGSDVSMLHLQKASNAQRDEMDSRKHIVDRVLTFKQAQRGGRKKGSRSKGTAEEYRHIIKVRNSVIGDTMTDDDFCEYYERIYGDPLSKSKLSRAKRWDYEGNR